MFILYGFGILLGLATIAGMACEIDNGIQIKKKQHCKNKIEILEELHRLKENGAITEEEFEKCKSKLDF